MVDRLSANEQRALMELLVYLAKADGKVEDIEEAVLHEYADLVAVDFDSLDGNLGIEELVPQFETPESKLIVLQQLIRLSHLDGQFTKPEKETILRIAERMGVPLHVLQEVDGWVLDGLRWVLRGEELMETLAVELRTGN